MANLNRTGPEGKGAKTGRKYGKCNKTKEEKIQIIELGKGQGMKRHSDNKFEKGKGKRLKYYKTTLKKR